LFEINFLSHNGLSAPLAIFLFVVQQKFE